METIVTMTMITTTEDEEREAKNRFERTMIGHGDPFSFLILSLTMMVIVFSNKPSARRDGWAKK